MKLSICMMVKNEEKNLPKCLEKLNPLIKSGLAELIIVDTGSDDNSVNISKQYTNQVYFHKWNNNFSEMRNISISYASGEWILIIDADEILNDTQELIALLNSPEINKYNTMVVQVKNLYNTTDESNYCIIASPRLFKNDGEFRYEGAVHNQPIYKKPELITNIYLTHYGYILNDKRLMEIKYRRTTELLKSELKKNPNNLYYLYQLGVSYDMHGDLNKALIEFRNAYNLLKHKNSKIREEYVFIYASYANTLYRNNEIRETLRVVKEAIAIKKDYVDLYYLAGISEKRIGNIQNSIKYFNIYMDLVKRYYELEISKNTLITMYYINEKSKSIAYYFLTQDYIDLGKYTNAYEFYKYITFTNGKIYTSINILIPLEKYTELRELYNSLTLINEKNIFLYTLENKIKELEDNQKIKLLNEFSLNEDVYGIFNKIRISNSKDEKMDLTKHLLNDIDFNKSPVFYCEIIENIKENMELIIEVFKKIEVWNLRNIVNYLVEKKGFKDTFENYILKNNEIINDIEETRVFISIATVLMLIYIKENNNVNEKYLNIFKAYINTGISFTKELYRMDRAEAIYKSINNQEDRFFIIMYIINNFIKMNDKKSAIKYLLEAVNTYKPIVKYIDVYKDEIIALEEEKTSEKVNKEFEEYKQKAKANINNLVNNGLLDEAKGLINEYEEIIKDDIEIYSTKAVIAIMENRFEEAELVLKKGLNIDKNNFDLIYNLGYLYEIQGRKSEALSAYIISKLISNDEYYRGLAEENITRLRGKKTKAYNVIISGKTEQCIGFEKLFKEWNIIGYVTYEKNNEYNSKVLEISNIKNYNYDFIVILDEENETKILKEFEKYGVKENIYLYSNFKISVIEGLDYRIRELLFRSNIEMIITGSSYAEVGIKVEQLNRNAINFAFSSQDLFYDYQLAKYLLSYSNVKNSIKYWILGLSYYCFDYDMSKSIAKYRIHRYANYIQEFHNNKDQIGINITKTFYEKRIKMKDYYEMNKKKEKTIIKYEDNEQEYIAKKNSTMNYSLTRKENIDIFYKFLSLLKVNNIKPIIVICPTSKYYYKYFEDCYQKNKFYKILNSFNKSFDFQILDYFSSNLFEDKDFWDYGHLNGNGAEKFTQILNKEIIW